MTSWNIDERLGAGVRPLLLDQSGLTVKLARFQRANRSYQRHIVVPRQKCRRELTRLLCIESKIPAQKLCMPERLEIEQSADGECTREESSR